MITKWGLFTIGPNDDFIIQDFSMEEPYPHGRTKEGIAVEVIDAAIARLSASRAKLLAGGESVVLTNCAGEPVP